MYKSSTHVKISTYNN